MWQDPIVEEVRKAGEELAKQANYDLHTFFENLRNNEKRQNQKIVSLKEDGRLKAEGQGQKAKGKRRRGSGEGLQTPDLRSEPWT